MKREYHLFLPFILENILKRIKKGSRNKSSGNTNFKNCIIFSSDKCNICLKQPKLKIQFANNLTVFTKSHLQLPFKEFEK